MPSRKTIFIRPHMIKLRMKLNGPSQLVKNENIHLLTAAFDHTDHTLKTYYRLVKNNLRPLLLAILPFVIML